MSAAGSIGWYDAHARQLATDYERISFEAVHAWLLDNIPERPGLILDVGAGSGRDAGWLASRGHEVVAVEPSAAMRAEASRRHPEARIRWLEDRLPGLEATFRLGLAFDLILLSAVWMHVAPDERPRAFRKLVTLLKPGGVLALTLRQGPSEPERPVYPVSVAEIERLAREHGAYVERCLEAHDCFGRRDVRWEQLLVRLPDDGTGALPLLRHVVLNDAKSSTYKLALLRAVARIAASAGGMARPVDDEHVSMPLGLVGLYWLRLFKPLVNADLPQSPVNRGPAGLGFIGKGYRALNALSHLDLRIGARFSGATAKALVQALRDACATIVRMPAFYMTYPNGGPIMRARRARFVPQPNAVIIDAALLSAFGELHVPTNLWRAFVRFDVWIEPALIAEWVRLMKGYAERQGRTLEDAQIAQAMVWSEPARDVAVARQRALQMMDSGQRLLCVWSKQVLSPDSLDVDHCLPWTAWPCDHLWNLMPAHARVNRQAKRNRLPSAERLRSAQEAIEAWWRNAYVEAPARPLQQRFFTEASASLPGLATLPAAPALDDVFSGVALKRLALKQDQQVPEWDG